MDTKIAIVGISMRFPDARNTEAFWANLMEGKSSITEIPRSRWSIDQHYSKQFEKNKSVSKWGGFVDNFEFFDPGYFGISPREAQLMDPQQRALLETTIECVEDAGYGFDSLKGSNTGFYLGACNFDYKEQLGRDLKSLEGHLATGTYGALLPNRVSHFMDWRGPSFLVDTACSSSLVALNLAASAIRNNECDTAIVAGVSYLCTPTYFVSFSQAGMLSETGQCNTFDESANGYVRGEGVGLVYLKPLDKAIEDNDQVYGVVDSVAINHGGKVQTVTSPSAYAQSKVIVEAMSKAGLGPEDISYIEAHGTGTPKGDPIELNGLKRAYNALAKSTGQSIENTSIALGSVKPQIGHLEAVSGIAGIIKVLLSMKNKTIPGMPNFNQINPRIKMVNTPFSISKERSNWDVDGLRRAGVSSFGFGGVNAHAIITEFPEPAYKKITANVGERLFAYSGNSYQSLRDYCLLIHSYLERNEAVCPADVAYTLTRRSSGTHRICFVYQGKDDLLQKLLSYCSVGLHSSYANVGVVGKDSSESAAVDLSADAASIAQGWVDGGKLNWSHYFSVVTNKIVYVPPYPFHHEHYFPAELTASKEDVEQSGERSSALCAIEAGWQRLNSPPDPVAGKSSDIEISITLLQKSAFVCIAESSVFHNVVQLPELPPYARIDCSTIWKEWVWRSVEILRAAVKSYQPSSISLVTDTGGPFPKTLFALLKSFEKEYQIPINWFDIKSLNMQENQQKLLSLLTRYKPVSGKFKVESEGNELVVSQEQTVANAFELTGDATPFTGDVFLISGGSGGIGRMLATHLVNEHNARVVVFGRSMKVPILYKESTDTTNTGRAVNPGRRGSIEYVQADCTNHSDMARLVEYTLEKYGSIDFVVHSAGTIRDKSLFFKSKTDYLAVVSPKSDGCTVLDQVTAHLPLKKFVVFSSITGLYGNPGQTDYAAANHYLGEFVEHRNALSDAGARQGHSVAIHWPYWSDGGMQIQDEHVDMLKNTMGIEPMSTKDGIEVFDYSLNTDKSQICVAPGLSDQIARCLSSSALVPALTIEVENSADSKIGVSSLHHSTLDVGQTVLSCVAESIGRKQSELDVDAPYGDLGIDSIVMHSIARDLSKSTGIVVSSMTMQQHGSIAALVTHIEASIDSKGQLESSNEPAAGGAAEPVRYEFDTLTLSMDRMLKRRKTVSQNREKRLSLIGMDLQVSGSSDWQSNWERYGKGLGRAQHYPSDRWSLLPEELRKGYSQRELHGQFLNDALRFDNAAFQMSNREAMLTDPQHRQMMQSVWKAIDNAGYDLSSFSKRPTAVIVCLDAADYAEIARFDDRVDEFSAHSSTPYLAANRISHYFDLEGHSEVINTACSSVFVGLERAADLIERGVVEQAVISACQLNLLPSRFEHLKCKNLLCEDNDIASFDERAHGFIRAEGVGTIIVKSRNLADVDNDESLAEIEGCASWHAGRGTGLTSPNPLGHNKAMRVAMSRAGRAVSELAYVEAHGTGSRIGDASEVDALQELLSQSELKAPCILSTLKADFGHLEVCSGIAAIAKAVLCMNHGYVPGMAGLASPLENIDPDLITVSAEKQLLPASDQYCVGLHAYGLGGVSAFVVLSGSKPLYSTCERMPTLDDEKVREELSDEPEEIVLSMDDMHSLRERARLLARHLQDIDEAEFKRIVRSHSHKFEKLPYKITIVCNSRVHAVTALTQFADDEHASTSIHDASAREVLSSGTARCRENFPGSDRQVDRYQTETSDDDLFVSHQGDRNTSIDFLNRQSSNKTFWIQQQ